MTDTQKWQEHELASAVASASPVRSIILDLWQQTRIDWGFVTDRLAGVFRRERWLSSNDRRLVAETLYGLIRHLRRIDAALAAGGLRTITTAADEDRLLAYLVLEAGLPVEDAARHRPGLDWHAVKDIDVRLAREADPARRLGMMFSLPDWLAQALVSDFGERAPALAHALNQRAPMTIRVNTLACSRDELRAELAAQGIETAPGRLGPWAVEVETRTNLFGLSGFKQGKFEAQDEGSQLIAELVAPPPRARVVDYCAGAGGKTLALAAMMANRGRIVAADIDARKLTELRRRGRRAGVTNVHAVTLSSEGAGLDDVSGKAQRVLVDAPCSGIGALRRNPEARWRLTPQDLARMPALQVSICERALELVAPGGRLVYATCTMLKRENQEVVAALLAAHSGLELMPIKAIWGGERARAVADDSGTYLSTMPDHHGTDGFFAAVLRRPG